MTIMYIPLLIMSSGRGFKVTQKYENNKIK